jgi:hypothetical protein
MKDIYFQTKYNLKTEQMPEETFIQQEKIFQS